MPDMAEVLAKIVALALVTCACCGQVSSQQKPDDPAPPILPTLSPPLPPPWILFPEPDPLPSPPDAPMPDLGTLQGSDKSKSRLKRALDRAKPNCLDAVVHTCWSSPPGDGKTLEEREFAEDMEIGTYAFKYKNYRGAELRFRHALEYKPGQPDATFKLAESLDKLGKSDEAKQEYQAYLGSQPNGSHADRARAALERLSKVSASKN
jgi:Tetratricopeptide repeat